MLSVWDWIKYSLEKDHSSVEKGSDTTTDNLIQKYVVIEYRMWKAV